MRTTSTFPKKNNKIILSGFITSEIFLKKRCVNEKHPQNDEVLVESTSVITH